MSTNPMNPTVKIRRQRRRNLMMRVVPGGVEVFIPHYLKPSHPDVRAFVQSGLKKLEKHIQPIPAEELTTADILAMVADWSQRIGVQPKRVQFRMMSRKWGSCSTIGSVTLNKALCWLPYRLAEYVVCHELVHLHVPNHGPDFKALMRTYMPDWEQRDAEVKARPIR